MQLSVVSLLAALTSGESLCGALTELFEVPVSVVGSGVAVCALHASTHLWCIPQSTECQTGYWADEMLEGRLS